MNIKDCFQLGKFTKPFRYFGEVILWMDVDDSSPYKDIKVVWIEEKKSLVPFMINKLKPHKDRFVAKIEGVESEEAAKALCGKDIYLPISELPKLDNKHFYFHEVLGWTVFDLKSGDCLGQITRVIDHCPYPMLEVDNDGVEVILPLPQDFKILVDRDLKILKVEVPEGLIDIFTNDSDQEVDDEDIVLH
tara:strand:+ start:339 stop:908 length:570 start_codon:yes stop_codon:yes gene_type:complete